MIQLTHGDILTADADALVNTVNCVGVMGRGIALQFKRAFPNNFKAYAAACKGGVVEPGKMFVFETSRLTSPRFIINFPTKRHWRSKSRLEDIETGLDDLVRVVTARDIRSVAIPPLGCGLGGLEWSDVLPLIEAALARVPDVDALIFEPKGAPAPQKMIRKKTAPKMTAGRAVLVGLMDRYLAGLMDPYVTLLELHKLMYFAQVAGERLRLRYVEGPYGPYAENLRHVLTAVEGHLVSGFADGGEAPDKPLELIPGAVRDASRMLDEQPATRERFERVADLVDGFETPFGLELLATVHWVISQKGISSPSGVLDQVYAWNERKKQFSPRQIELARDILQDKGWLRDPAAPRAAAN